jgi:hypothetical protein
LFETVVQRRLREGLVGGEGFAVDASLIAADANKQRPVPGDQWPLDGIDADAGRAVREYLATLDDAAFGAASEVKPKFVSASDPAAQWTGAHKGRAFFAYATNYLIDTENAVILDVEASRAIRQAEVGATRTMIDRTARRFGIRPRHLAADSAYCTREHCVETSKIVKAALLAGSLVPNSPALAKGDLFLWMKRPIRCPLSPAP